MILDDNKIVQTTESDSGQVDYSRRKALGLLGLFGLLGYAAPTLLTVSDAEAGRRRRSWSDRKRRRGRHRRRHHRNSWTDRRWRGRRRRKPGIQLRIN